MWSRVTLMDLQADRQGVPSRVAWADVAKAISIILLVLWTTVGDRVYLNEMLILVRMPLFFFVSGLFAHRVVTKPDLWTFLRDKVGNLLYLYALWIALLFLARDMVAHLWYGREIDPMRQLALFWDPLFTIWFLYALAVAFLAARLLRNVPVALVMTGAIALYLYVVATGDWRHQPFLDRVARLFPFFWIGLVAAPLAGSFVERFHRFWPLPVGLFLALSWALFDSPLAAWGTLTFPVTLIGIAGLLLLSRALAGLSWSRPLVFVGGSTLFIYVMHRIALFYVEHGLRFAGLEDFPGIDAIVVVPVVAACAIFGRWAQRGPWTAWLFAAPWTLKGRERDRPVRAAAAGAKRAG